MRTVVLGEPPVELAAFIERRHRLGQDLYDEVWEGAYYMAPAPRPAHGITDHRLAVLLSPLAAAAGLIGSGPFNLGESDNYRVPDQGYHRTAPTETFVSTAAVVVEVVSPDDQTYAKFAFYATHGVDELIVADPEARTVRCYRLAGGEYVQTPSSDLLGVPATQLESDIQWP